MAEIETYPSVYNLGHRNLEGLFDGPVVAQEKVDGSQFSFGLIDGELKMRSKGAIIYVDSPNKMFAEAVALVQELESQLHEGWVYRGEYLMRPKHNTLTYDRVPNGHVVLFDIQTEGYANFLSYDRAEEEAERFGLEVVPLLKPSTGEWNLDSIKDALEQTSFLGGAAIEGIVFKNYNRYGHDSKVLMGKHVSEAFKEVHAGAWKAANPGKGDVIQRIIRDYTTPARWSKAVQHLRDSGELPEGPQAIGPLMREVNADVLKEAEADIKEVLWKYAWPQISRGITKGFPEWYKNLLAESQFSSIE